MKKKSAKLELEKKTISNLNSNANSGKANQIAGGIKVRAIVYTSAACDIVPNSEVCIASGACGKQIITKVSK